MTTLPLLAGPLGLGGPEMIIIFIALLLLFGAKKLPELARGMGRSLGEFKKARQEFEDEIHKGGDDISKPASEAKPFDEGEKKPELAEATGKQQYPG